MCVWEHYLCKDGPAERWQIGKRGSASYFFDVAVQSDVRATAFAVGPPCIVYNLFVMLNAV